jgi:hypothetical protein
MSRVALTEVVFLATNPASFGRGLAVSVLERDTEDLVDVFSAETGGTKLAQPLTTDLGGRPRGEGGALGWVNEGSYTLEIVVPARSPEEDPTVLHVPWEAAKGGAGREGGGGGAVDSVAGKTGAVVLTVADIEGLSTNGKGYVNHGEDAGEARPSGFASIEWHGSAEPENAIDGDTWIEDF